MYRYSPSHHPPDTHHPGYTLPLPPSVPPCHRGLAALRNMAVGLKSVRQLSLGDQISGFLGITEVYNLRNVGIINNHFVIPGNE